MTRFDFPLETIDFRDQPLPLIVSDRLFQLSLGIGQTGFQDVDIRIVFDWKDKRF